jgi:hypothetical protein
MTRDGLINKSLKAKLLPVEKPSKMWKGLDINLPLVWHIVQGRAPGALMAKRDGPAGGFKPKQQKKFNRRGPKNKKDQKPGNLMNRPDF